MPPETCLFFDVDGYELLINNEVSKPEYTWGVASVAATGWRDWMRGKGSIYVGGVVQILLDGKVVGVFFARKLAVGAEEFAIA